MYIWDYNGIVISILILFLGFFFWYIALGKPRFIIPRKRYTTSSKIYCIVWILGFLLISIIPLRIGRIHVQTISYSRYAIQVFLDVSLSMTATDIKPSRFAAAKQWITSLHQQLPIHYFSLIPFSGIPFVWIPYSQDIYGIQHMINNLQLGNFPPVPEFVGTAIGDALLLGIAKAQNLPDDVQPLFVLITDGDSNRWYDPDQVIPILQKLTIPVYTLAFAKEDFLIGEDRAGNQITTAVDLDLLQTISTQTDGKFFHIRDTSDMQQAFDTISTLVHDNVVSEKRENIVSYNNYIWNIILCIGIYIALYQWFIFWQTYKK